MTKTLHLSYGTFDLVENRGGAGYFHKIINLSDFS
jgi:hypothetical protein